MLYLQYRSMSETWKMKPYRAQPLCVSQVGFICWWEFRSAASLTECLRGIGIITSILDLLITVGYFLVCFHIVK